MISFEKFVKFFITIFVISLLIIAGFNYLIDPGGIFNNKKVNLAVTYLLNGNTVGGLTNFDERIFKKEFIIKSIEKPETIVFGSSRAMGIKAEFDKDKNNFANYSVSAANFNDDIALFSIYYNKLKNVPKKLILAVEPWDLNKNRGDTRWKSLKKEYYDGLSMIGINSEEVNNSSYTFDKLKTLVSISYLRNSIKSIRNDNPLPFVADYKELKSDVIRPDGSVKYGKMTNEKSLKEVNIIAKDYISKSNISQLNDFTKLDRFEINKFEAFVKYLKDRNVKVVLYFPPYHPIVYKFFQNNKRYNTIIDAENYFLKFSLKENLETIGSYNPALCGVDENDFSDGRHLRTSGYAKVFKNKF